MTKKSRQIFIILRTKKSFKVKQNAFFIIFKGLSVAKISLRPGSAHLIFQNYYSDVPAVSNVFFAAEFEHGNFPVGLQN